MDVPETDVPQTDDPEMDVPEIEGRNGHPRHRWHRWVAQMDAWPWEEKPGQKGPPFSWLFIPGTYFCAIHLGHPSLGDRWRQDRSP